MVNIRHARTVQLSSGVIKLSGYFNAFGLTVTERASLQRITDALDEIEKQTPANDKPNKDAKRAGGNA